MKKHIITGMLRFDHNSAVDQSVYVSNQVWVEVDGKEQSTFALLTALTHDEACSLREFLTTVTAPDGVKGEK